MVEALRVLLIEDSSGDERLIREQLSEAQALRLEITSCTSLDSGLAYLSTTTFDLVLLDLSLPDSFGIDTVRSVIRKHPSLPIVVLTGTADRQIAEEALHLGAQDYMPKSEMTARMLERTISYAIERHRTRDAIRKSEQLFRAIFQASPIPVMLAKPNGESIVAANQAYLRMMGYREEELADLSIAKTTHPEDLESDLQGIRGVLDSNSTAYDREKRLLDKNGRVMWARMSSTLLRNESGTPEQVLVVQQDITAEREARIELLSERERLNSVMETMPAFLYLQTKDYAIRYANRRFESYFGKPRDRRCHQIFRDSNEPCVPCSTLEVLETGQELVREWTDEQGRTFEIRERPFLSQTGEDLVLVIGTEITELVRATQALRSSERKFRELAEMLPEVVFECDLKGNLTYANQVAGERFGHTNLDFDRGLNVYDMISPEDHESVGKAIDSLGQRPVTTTQRFTAIRKDGSRFPVMARASIVFQDEIPVGLRGIIIDFTEQAAAQQAIEESEARLRLLFDTAPVGIVYLAVDGTVLGINRTAARRHDKNPKLLVGHSIEDSSFTPADCLNRLAMTAAGTETLVFEDRIDSKNGVLWFQRRYTPIRDVSGDVSGVQIISSDITSVKEAQQALEMADDIFRRTPVGMFIYRYEDPDRFILVDANPEAERITGIYLRDWQGRELNDIWPAARALGITQAYLDAYHDDQMFSTEDLAYQDARTKGRYRKRVFRIPGNRLVSSFEDVSDLREAETALRNSELRYRSLFENAALGIYQTTPDGRILAANAALVRMLGYDDFADLSARNLEDEGYEPTTPRSQFKAEIERAGSVSAREARWQRKDGTTIHIRENARAVRDSEGRVLYYEGTLEDITEQKQAAQQLSESERKYRAIVQTSPMGILTVDLKGVITSCNQAFLDMTEYEQPDFVGKHFTKLPAVHAKDLPKYIRVFRSIVVGRSPEAFETTWQTRSGAVREGEVRVRVMEQEDRAWIIQVLVQDITDRRAAEEQLRASEAMQRSILEASPVGIGLIQGEILRWVSDRICEMTGYQAEELIGQTPMLTAPDEAEYRRIQQAMEADLRTGGVALTETRWVRKDGSIFDADLRFSVLNRDDPSKGGIFTILDVTERKAMERSLLLTQHSMDSTDVIILWLSPEGQILLANDTGARMLGYTRNELFGLSAWDIQLDYPREGREALWQQLSKTEPASETIFTRKDGSEFPVELTAQRLEFQGQEYEFVFATDISERKAAQAALQESEKSYRTIFESASDVILLHDAETGRLLEGNPKTEDLFGYPVSEFLELSVSEFSSGLPPYTQDEALRLIHAAADGAPQLFEWHCRHKDGSLFWGEVNLRQATVRGRNVVLAVVRDIDARKQLEAQLRQGQKLESIGTLASGVAHEINNPLMGMINYAELISSRVEDESLREYAEGIKSEGARVARIVRNLLSFSRQDQEEHSRARICDIVDASMSLVGSLLRKDFIELKLEVDEDLPQIRCRSQQIQQVIINLVTNARDSLNEQYLMAHENKVVRIQAQALTDEEGDWLRVTVEDTGVGIAENVRDRIFDPFFTTKSRNEGTGLGLSISYGIVGDHGGRLTVHSEPGVRTCFFVDLPAIPADE